MNPELFKLISTLPGLYLAKQAIEKEIEEIESKLKINGIAMSEHNNVKKPPKVLKKSPKDLEFEKKSNQMKSVWANYTPEQRAKRIAAARRGIIKSVKISKAA